MSGTLGRLAGVAYLFIDGTAYQVVSDAKYSPTRFERETLKGMDGIHGFKEMPSAGFIGAKVRDNGSMTAGDFNAMTNSEVILQLANGKTVSGNPMWNTSAVEVDAAEAVFDVKFEGTEVVEATV